MLAGTDRNAFEDIDRTGGILRFLTPPDYEADNRYTVTVEASAGSHTTRQTVTVSVTNVNEEPEITKPADTAIPYEENDTGPVATFSATDPERDPIQWTANGIPTKTLSPSPTASCASSSRPTTRRAIATP